MRFFALLLLLLPVLVLSRWARADCEVQPRTAVPLQIVEGALLVPAIVNGIDATFILGTGAARSVVTREATQRLALARDQWVGTAMRGVGGVERLPTANPKALTFGGVPLVRRTLSRDTSLTVGVTGAGATDNDIAVLLKEVLGLRLNIVPGYQDSNAIGLAVENGELDGQLIGYVAGKIAKPAWTDPSGSMKILLQFARKTRHPELPDAPTARELAPNDTALKLIDMAELPYVVGRPFAAPPGIPADRAEALQQAFAKLIRDPEFLGEAKRLNIDLTPLDAKDTFAAVEALGRSPEDLRNRLRDILYGPVKK